MRASASSSSSIRGRLRRGLDGRRPAHRTDRTAGRPAAGGRPHRAGTHRDGDRPDVGAVPGPRDPVRARLGRDRRRDERPRPRPLPGRPRPGAQPAPPLLQPRRARLAARRRPPGRGGCGLADDHHRHRRWRRSRSRSCSPSWPCRPGATRASAGDGHASGSGCPLPLIALAVAIACYVASEIGVSNWLVRFLETASIGLATSALALFWGCLALGRIVTAVLGDRFDHARFAATAALVAAIALVAAVLVPSLPASIVLFGVVGFAFGPVYPLIMAVGGDLYPTRSAAVSGFLSGSRGHRRDRLPAADGLRLGRGRARGRDDRRRDPVLRLRGGPVRARSARVSGSRRRRRTSLSAPGQGVIVDSAAIRSTTDLFEVYVASPTVPTVSIQTAMPADVDEVAIAGRPRRDARATGRRRRLDLRRRKARDGDRLVGEHVPGGRVGRGGQRSVVGARPRPP